ncbi:MAG: T9SS type A sorting domain-containing protein, partial [Ignavibacterium sp.]|nr:T9SS type A sorting domain-containing protein [Ignavibacterium sp.]MDW8376060.1 FlgD immunoglobulin-like domain containing protein [Ignavibacteriales bacterium]
NTSNSDLPDDYVSALAIDAQGNKWIGTYGGLAKFDGTNWTVYKTSNSGLPNNEVRALAIDALGNKWIGTGGGGLAVYREGGVLNAERKEETILNSFTLYQNYPNPFNPSTVISVALPENSTMSLKIYNSLGQEIKTLVDGSFIAGIHNFTWDGTDNSGKLVSAGVYFYRVEAGNNTAVRKMILMK